MRRTTRRISTPSTTERQFVLNRDGTCVVGQIRDLASIGRVYDPFEVGACQGPLTYGHARTQAGGLRPRADNGFGRMFAIAECLRHNVDHTEARSDIRAEINRRLDVLYPNRREHEQPER